MMKTKLLKTTAVTMTLILALGLSACTSGNSKDSGKDSSSGKTAQTESDSKNNPDSKEEAAKLYQKLMQKENDILAANSKLWEKVFLAANKSRRNQEDRRKTDCFRTEISGLRNETRFWRQRGCKRSRHEYIR